MKKLVAPTAAEILVSRGADDTTKETGTLPLGGQAGEPGDVSDEWGNLDAMLDAESRDTMRRLNEEEMAEFGETIADAWAREGHGPHLKTASGC